MYNVEVKALVIDGLETTYRIENVEVKANQVTEVGHTFKTGIAMIGAKSANGLVDAVVNILETNTRKKVAGGRTYTSDSSNPKRFILNPGTYEVTLTALGDHKGKKESFTIVVKQGSAVEKTISF